MSKKRWQTVIFPVLIVMNVGLLLLVVMGTVPGRDEEGSRVKVPAGYSPVDIPESVSFAGEQVPLWRFDIRESLDRELLVNSYFHSQTIRYLKLAPRYFSVIEPILKEKGVPDDFKYLAVAESGFDPRAVSPARAVGLWQFLQGTARDFGLEVNREVDERYHVERSTYAACDYLLEAYEKFGTWTMVAAAYNGGMSGVEKQIIRQKGNSYYNLLFGSETSRYVFRILALKIIMENPEAYNFYIPEEEKYPFVPTREITITGKVENFGDFALAHGINYKLLKDFNPWLRDNFLTNPADRTYTVMIPLLSEETGDVSVEKDEMSVAGSGDND